MHQSQTKFKTNRFTNRYVALPPGVHKGPLDLWDPKGPPPLIAYSPPWAIYMTQRATTRLPSPHGPHWGNFLDKKIKYLLLKINKN